MAIMLLFVAGLVIVGLSLIAATAYFEAEWTEPGPEDYHFTPHPTGAVVWRSRNTLVTAIGALLIAAAAGMMGFVLINVLQDIVSK